MARWYLHVVIVGTLLALSLGTLGAPPVRAALPAAGQVARAAEPMRPASLAAPAVLTPTLYLPGVFNNFDPQYVSPYGYTTYEGVSDTLGRSMMQAAGSRMVTTYLYWSTVEPNAPVGTHTYNFGFYDVTLSQAKEKGLEVMVLFTSNPTWAATYGGGPVNNPADLVSVVTALAERYDGDGVNDAPNSPVIKYWSFYSEPDNNQAWRAAMGRGFWGDNPAGYAAMLAQVSDAIHAANPHARVLNGGLAYEWFTTDTVPSPGPFVQGFLGGVLQALNQNHGGAANVLDGIAFHYYPVSTVHWPTIREKTLEIKGILSQHGVGYLPLIVPEMGYWSASTAGSSEAGQAQRMVQMYVRGFSVGIRHLSWFSVFDHTGHDTETHGLFRGLGPDLTQPKPAYAAYQNLAAELPWFQYLAPYSAAGVEGYTFRTANGQNKTVLWATSAPPRTASFAQACVRRVGLLGGATQVTDGLAGDADGTANGQVALTLTAVNEPVYAGACTP